jgi:hypothetical protein
LGHGGGTFTWKDDIGFVGHCTGGSINAAGSDKLILLGLMILLVI